MQDKPSIEVISKGTYGCILKPSLNCKGQIENDVNYITKIQKSTKVSMRESSIGEKIKKYDKYFAPVLKTCAVSLATVDDDELEKCEFINKQDTNAKYESNKIKYVGEYSLIDYFEKKTASSKDAKKFMKQIINSHLILLDGINLLFSLGIIHYDLKANNIICQTNNGRPILIDFGMSVDITKFENPDYDYEDAFGIYGPEYGPWCIDICVLTYMTTVIGKTWKDKTMTRKDIKKIINDYITKNTGIADFVTMQEQRDFKQKLEDYFRPFEEKPWQLVLDDLLKYKGTWDNYSLSYIFLQMLNDLSITQYVSKYGYLDKYIQLLKQVLLSIPVERLDAAATIAKVNEIFENVPREDNDKFKQELMVDFTDEAKQKNRLRRVNVTKLNTINSENKIYSQ